MNDLITHGFYIDRGHKGARALIRGSFDGVKSMADRFNNWYDTDEYVPEPIEGLYEELGIPTEQGESNAPEE